jgi:glycosyltransferase involved in cell wall biosynthesis
VLENMFVAIVPAYNEEKHIGSVVRSLLKQVDRIVVIDDGSSDSTAKEAKSAGAIVICHEINRGQGAAIETGHEYARLVGADYVLHFDADGQFDTNDIKPALTSLKEKRADMLLGSRFLDNRSNLPLVKRHFVLPVGRLVNRILTGVSLTDAHNGFRILNRHALDSIHLSHDRMAHASEITFLAHKANLVIIEFPVKVVYREYGQSAFGGIEIVRDFLFGKVIK